MGLTNLSALEFSIYCDTVYQRRTTLLVSGSKRVNFSSRPNLKFLRFLLFLIVDISANIPPPLKTKSTIVILTKYLFQRGVKCLQNTDTNRNNESYIYGKNLNIFQTLHNLLNESKISLVFKRFHVESFV